MSWEFSIYISVACMFDFINCSKRQIQVKAQKLTKRSDSVAQRRW